MGMNAAQIASRHAHGLDFRVGTGDSPVRGITPPPLKRRAKRLLLHKLRFERIGKSFPHKGNLRFDHATRAQGEPPARVPHDTPFPRKGLSPLLRFFKKEYFAVCGRQRGASPHTPPPLKRRVKLLFLHKLPFERICKKFAQRKPTIYPAFHAAVTYLHLR